MSYILDALKKADAERERDAAAVPDLHAQADTAARDAGSSARYPLWLLLALGAALLVLGLLAWRWLIAAPADVALPDVQAQAPAPAPAPAPASQAIATPPAPAPLAPPAIAAYRPPPARAAALPAVAAPPKPTAAAAPTQSPKPASIASAATQARLYQLAELPADIRAQLPALAVGGSVHSPKAGSRIVILNGQVFREGDQPVAGLTVEQIGLKSTVLAFRGARFEIKH